MAPAKPQAYTAGSNPVLKFEGAFHVTKHPAPPGRAIHFYVQTYPHHHLLKAMEASGKKPVSMDSSSQATSIPSNTYIQPQPCLFSFAPLPPPRKEWSIQSIDAVRVCPQPTHFHPRQHEYFHVVKGSLTVEINGVAHEFTAKDGEYALPPGYDLTPPSLPPLSPEGNFRSLSSSENSRPIPINFHSSLCLVFIIFFNRHFLPVNNLH